MLLNINMTEAGLDDDDDIYQDLDLVLSPKATSRCDDEAQTGTDSWIGYADVLKLQNPTATLTSRLEAERKTLEMDLLLEFVADEGIKRKSKLEEDPEFQELQKEVLRLQNLNSEKDAQISELTAQNINLKKNISSLYKTAKSEIEQKDLLLADANRRLEKSFFHKNRLPYKRDQYSQTVNSSSDTPEETSSVKSKSNIDKNESNLKHQNSLATRKRLLSPDKRKTNKGGENHKRAKQSSIEKSDSVSPTTSNDCNEQLDENASTTSCNYKEQTEHVPMTSTSNDCKEQSVEQSSKSSEELSSSPGTDETNNTLFNLLPDTMKRSFLEYESSQVESLNKLKQSFLDYYFVQSKNKSLGLDDVSSSKPDVESTGPLVIELCDSKASSSSSVKETGDLSSVKEKTSVSHKKHVNDGNSRNERTENSLSKPVDANVSCSSIKEGSDLNGTKENPFLSLVKHPEKSNSINNRTQNSKELSNKHQKHPTAKAMNLSEAYQSDVAKLYRQRKEKLPVLLKRQLYNYHIKTRKK